MASVTYNVDLVTQAQNPICWVASCAMVKGWGTQRSVGVGDFTGFDPSNSSIPNPSDSWSKCINMMTNWGFNMQSVATLSQINSITPEELLQALTQLGPAVLLHRCEMRRIPVWIGTAYYDKRRSRGRADHRRYEQ